MTSQYPGENKITNKEVMVLACPAADHSNRLFQNAYFEAFCIENNIKYYNPTFWDMHRYYVSPCKLLSSLKDIPYLFPMLFANTKLQWWFRGVFFDIIHEGTDQPTRFKRIYRVMNKFFRVMHKHYERYRNRTVDGFEIRNGDKIPRYVRGFRDPNSKTADLEVLTKTHRDEIALRYKLKKKYYRNIILIDLIDEAKECGKTVIGVHIRGGDYETHLGGKYFYSDDVFQKAIDHLRKQITKVGGEVVFILFSDRTTNIDLTNDVFLSLNDWYVDHYLMSICNYLIGPPSTFTKWASFIGSVKLYHMQTRDDMPNIDDFI